MTDEEAIKEILIQQHKAGIDEFFEEIVKKLKFVKNDKKECQEMTDNEIIKALEHCCTAQECYLCDYQPSKQDRKGTVGCSLQLMKDALDLINRQQAEIERLEHLTNTQNIMIDELNEACNNIKADSIKDFAERLKDYLRQQPQWYVIRENYKDVFFGIEKVVKKNDGGQIKNKITISTTKGFFQLENVFCVHLNIDNRCLIVMYKDKADNEDKKVHIPIDEIIEFNLK